MVFHARAVLRQQARPVFGVALHPDTALLLYPLDISRDGRQHRSLALVDQSGPRVGAEDAEHRHLGRGDQVAVTEIEPEEIGVGRLIIRRPRRPRTSRAPRPLRIELGAAQCPLAVEPMADGISGETESFADLTEGDAFRAEPQSLFANVGRVHALIFEQGYDNLCPRWDSNPHCMVFETIFSAGWNTGASKPVPHELATPG